MKKLCTFLLLLLCVTMAFGQMTVLWEKTAVNGTMPGWFDATHLTRGLAYAKIGGQDRLFVVTRNGGNFVYKLDAATGDTITHLKTTGMSGGTYTLNDVGVSADSIVYVGNLCLGTGADTLFKVYKWTADTTAPVVVINYVNKGVRLGDKFTVTGSAVDNSLIIWAASSTAGQKKVYKFTTADNGATFTPTVITLDMGAVDVSSSAAVGPLPDGSFYWNANGRSVMKFKSDGTLIGTVPGSVVATGSTAIRHFTTVNGCEFFMTHQFGTGNENARIVKVPMGDPTKSETYAITPTQRLNANTNGVGDVDFKDNGDGTFTAYVLSTNNGYGAYVIDPDYMAGNYYVGTTGTAPDAYNPNFARLKTAFDGLNKQKILGNINLYITSDIDEPNTAADGFLGLAVNPGEYTITIKPYTGVQPKINLAYPADATDGPSGAFIIGCPELGTTSHHINWPDLRATRNIIIDGSNTVDGTTRDLTIQNLTTSQRNGFPMLLVGDVANVTIKNCNIYYQAQGVTTSGNLFVSALQIRSRNQDTMDRVPNNILIENNHISSNFTGVCQSAQAIGFYQSGTPVPTVYPWAVTIKNNLIEGTRRAIALYKAGSVDIIGNEIKLNQAIAGGLSSEAIYSVDVLGGSSINILENKITQIAGMLTSGTSIVNALSVESYGTHYVYNNMITGFEILGSTPAGTANAVKNSSANATVHFYHNTVCLNDLADGGLGNVNYNAFTHGNGSNDLYNNIFAITEINFKTYMLYFSSTPVSGSLVSDQNNYWFHDGATFAQFSNWGGDDSTWATWRNGTGHDANSVQKMVNFASGTDLHLTGASIGDNILGCNNVGINTDYDGDERPNYTYMGADEASIKLSPANINVTLLVNTSGVPDTMQTYSVVQIRGSWPFTWDNTSQGVMTNIGGDY
ncbi:MAG: hypothetical protein PHW79_04460, partial [Candidatus Marinimicrobia bacterium]|nr:hypothetical protein [Candidatus Neomarinimicrobiota bacterium]